MKIKNISKVRKINTGKESDVFLVADKDGAHYALKEYRPDFLKSSNSKYLEGKHYKEKSIAKAVSKKTSFGKKVILRNWVKREYYMLKKLYDLNFPVPKVFDVSDTSILMEFIGTNGVPAPKLSEINLPNEKYKFISEELKILAQKLFDFGVIHGDLSKYNVLYLKDKIYIIDFPQSIDVRKNKNSDEFFKRDIENLNKISKS